MSKPGSAQTPSLATFLRSIQSDSVETSIERLISLLKRRQIRNARPCAVATVQLLRRVVLAFPMRDVQQLIERVQQVGRRLTGAQPREIVVGNMVRRVLGCIRNEAEEDREGGGDKKNGSSDSGPSRPLSRGGGGEPKSALSSSSLLAADFARPSDDDDDDVVFALGDAGIGSSSSSRPPLLTSHASYAVTNAAPMVASMFSLLSHPATATHSPLSTPPHPSSSSPSSSSLHRSLTPSALAQLNSTSLKDLRDEILSSLDELLDELDQASDQIAAYALEHIHANEIILTYAASTTVQKFLLKAARTRRFTVIHAEAYPNHHLATHATLVGRPHGGTTGADADADYHYDAGAPSAAEHFTKPLVDAGLTVILIPDASAFALMSRVNKVLLPTHAVLANGGLVAAAGTQAIALAARAHKTPVIVATGVYKFAPAYPFDFARLIEHGDAGRVVDFRDGEELVGDGVDVLNPVFDYVDAELVDLYVTNLGGHAPSDLGRVVADCYRGEDVGVLGG